MLSLIRKHLAQCLAAFDCFGRSLCTSHNRDCPVYKRNTIRAVEQETSLSHVWLYRKLEEIEAMDGASNPAMVQAMKTILQGLMDSQIEKVGG